MGNEEIRELTLRRLLEDNFMSSRLMRKMIEVLEDVSLKHYFQGLASRRSQFAIEITEEIALYSGKKPYIPSTNLERNREVEERDDKAKCIKKALKIKKASLQKYQESLCQIHDGSCREILLRHKAYLENCIFELKAIKTLLKNFTSREGKQSGMRSYS